MLLIATCGPVDDAASADEANEAPSAPFEIFLAERGSSDANDGLSWSTAVRTLARAYEILQEHQSTGEVRIEIGPGDYYCRGMSESEAWSFHNGSSIVIEPLKAVPGPAKTTAEHPNRPVF